MAGNPRSEVDEVTNKPIHVAIMMNTLVRGRMGGTEVYADELVARLGVENDGLKCTDVLVRGETPLNPQRNTHFIPTPVRGIGGIARLASYLYNSVFQHKLRATIGTTDIAFYPFSAITPRLKPTTALVSTIHDLQHRDLPHLFSRGQKIYRWLTYELPARKARAIVVVSEFTKQSVATRLKVPTSKIHRIYPGIDHDFFHPCDSPTAGASEPFIYYPARGLSHKNHKNLLVAMELIRNTHPELKLVLTGADANLLGKLPDYVRHEGHVSRERVRALMWSAEALVFPSLYEGFGFPPIEAMASGCPVVSSNAGSLAEVCGDAAELVNPTSPDSIARGVEKVLSQRSRYIASGLENAARFNWSETAHQHAELFHQLAGR